jgi:hypothetical protein
MLNLAATTDKLQVTTDAAQNVDVHASWGDISGTTVSFGKTNTAITTATTTDVVAAPGASTVRNIKTLHIRNKGSAAVTITVIFDQNGTDFELHKESLGAGEALSYVEGIGFFRYQPAPGDKFCKLTADLASTTVTTMANVTGMNLPVLAGNYYKFKFNIIYQSAATTNGVRLGVTVPAFTRFTGAADLPVSTAADGTANIFRGHLTSSGDSVVGTGTPAVTTDFMGELEGIIVPSADGDIQLQYGAEVTTSAITMRQGSLGKLEIWP